MLAHTVLGLSVCFSASLYLDDEQNEEVCVGYSQELLKQVARQESDQVVLGGGHHIVLWREGGRERERERERERRWWRGR